MTTSVHEDCASSAQFTKIPLLSRDMLGIPDLPLNNTIQDKTKADGVEIRICQNLNIAPPDATTEKTHWYTPYWGLLRANSVFLVLCAQYSISISGDALNMMATLSLLQRETSSSLALSGLLATRQVPYIVLAPVAGWLGDRFEKLQIMAVCDAVRMFLVLLYLICAWGGSVWLLFALGILQHSLATLSDPAFHAMVPKYVPPESLQYAHTIITTLWAIIVTVAYAVGGALVAIAGPVPNIIGDSLCYALSLALIGYLMYHTQTLPYFISAPEGHLEEEATTRSTCSEGEDCDEDDSDVILDDAKPEVCVAPVDELDRQDQSTGTTGLSEVNRNGQGLLSFFVEAVKYISCEPYLICLGVMRLLDALGYGAVSLISIKLVEEELHIAGSVPVTLGVIYVALGIAAFIGPGVVNLLVGSSLERTHAFFVMCTIIETTAMALICWSPHVSVLIFAAAMHMAAMSSNHVTATALTQRLVPEQLYARVNALDTCASAILELGALFVTGALMDDLLWSSRTVMLVFALIGTASSLVVHSLFSMCFTPNRVLRLYGTSILLKVDDD